MQFLHLLLKINFIWCYMFRRNLLTPSTDVLALKRKWNGAARGANHNCLTFMGVERSTSNCITTLRKIFFSTDKDCWGQMEVHENIKPNQQAIVGANIFYGLWKVRSNSWQMRQVSREMRSVL